MVAVAGWWERRVVPRVVDRTCSGVIADGWRARTCGPGWSLPDLAERDAAPVPSPWGWFVTARALPPS